MNLLALLFALACEHGLMQLLHLRELRWLDRCCAAAASARELLEGDATRHRHGAHAAAEEPGFVQGSNRMFGAILCFVVLGAPGTWLFRGSGLRRGRAACEAFRAKARPAADWYSGALTKVHGVVASVPPGELDVAARRGAIRIVLRARRIWLRVVALLVPVGSAT
jgi:hypothetical protein